MSTFSQTRLIRFGVLVAVIAALAIAAAGWRGGQHASAAGGPIVCYDTSTGSGYAFASVTTCTSGVWNLFVTSQLWDGGGSVVASANGTCLPWQFGNCSYASAFDVRSSSGCFDVIGTHQIYFPPTYIPPYDIGNSYHPFCA